MHKCNFEIMATSIHSGIQVFSTEGRGIRATQPIRAGTYLVREQPFAYVLLEHEREQRCEYFLAKREKLRKCGGCQDVLYCNNDCQIAAYKSHQYECRIKKKKKHTSLPEWSSARIMIQVLFLKQKKRKNNNDIPAEFPILPSQLCDGPDGLSNAETAVKSLEEYVGTTDLEGWDHKSLMNLYAKLVVNSFCLFDEYSRTLIGEAIYLRSAMFNHHCEPNCSFIYNGKTMEIRTLRDIKPGEECFIHYVKVLHPINMRRQELFKNYKFWCDCARCQREFQSLSSAELNARMKIEEMESKAFSSVAKMDNEFDGNFYKMFEDCETALNSIQNELEPTNPAIRELYMKYQEACIGLHRWKEAAQSGMVIIEACKTHLLPTDPMLGFHLWRVAKIQAKELNQPIAARDLLQQAIDVMSIAYGSTHPMTIEAKEILETIIADQ